MMRIARWILGVSISFASTCPVMGQPPSEIHWLGYGTCGLIPTWILVIDCPGYPTLWTWSTLGTYLYGPLLCVGPVEISLQISERGGAIERLPVFVELRTDTGAERCSNNVGPLVWQAHGVFSCDPDSLWVHSPPIDTPRIVGLGTTYWIQLRGFATFDQNLVVTAESPYIAALTVDVLPTPVAQASWGAIKSLYR